MKVARNLYIDKEGSCEGCGLLEEFDVYWSDGDCTWCLICAECLENFDASEEEIKTATRISFMKKRDYFTKRLKETQELLKRIKSDGAAERQ